MWDMKYSPDGKRLAVFLVYHDGGHRQSVLLTLNAVNYQIMDRLDLAVNMPQLADDRIRSDFSWMPDGTIEFLNYLPGNSLFLSELVQYNPETHTLRTLLRWHDLYLMRAYSPDGNWLAYRNDRNLWLLDLRTPHAPLKIATFEDTFYIKSWK